VTAVVTLLGSMLAVLGASAPAQSETTVSPVEPGTPPVVRGNSVDLSVDQVAMSFYRTSATATFAPREGAQAVLSAAIPQLATVCLGDDPSGVNNSPRDTITVTDPNGNVVLSQVSPARNITLAGGLTTPKYQPLSTQPVPGPKNYRGDFPESTAYHGMQATLDLSGKPAGMYTVTTSKRNMVKTGGGACSVGTPGPGGTVTPGEAVETDTFEYRPWQVNFKDVLNKGKVHANVSPREFTFSIGSKSAPIYQGTPQNQTFFSFGGQFLLPNDPEACSALITNCLPSGAVECDPAAGCTPRIMVINQRFQGTPNGMIGFFDLETKAFIASAEVDGTTRVLFSLGTANDTAYHSLLNQLAAYAAAQGVDLMSILATEVSVANATDRLSLSLLNGLQIDPSGGEKGIRIFTPGTVQAGVILDVYASLRLDGNTACVSNSATSADGPTRYSRTEDNGYIVNKSDLLPSVPAVGPLVAITSGPIYSIRGKFTGSGATVANVSSAVIGVDTAADEPNGYPVWISPFVSGVRVGAPKTMDFLGTATWSASENPLPGGCLVVDFMLGTGVAIYDNPLPVGLGSLVDVVGTPSPQLLALQESVDTAVQDVIDLAATNPVVESLLGNLVGSLPLSDLP
jgi:hypothetical protein